MPELKSASDRRTPEPEAHGGVLVTGAASGIGRAIALRLSGAGYDVVACGRNESALADLVREGSNGSGRLMPLVLDVTDAAAVNATEERARQLLAGRPIEVLVNNAGYSHPGPMELIEDAALRRQFDVNVFGLMALTRTLAPTMRERGRGRIVNISSGMGLQTLPLHGAYNASKYALEALSDALRMELAPWGVQVILIEPGTIRSGFSERALTPLRHYAGESTPYQGALKRVAATYAKTYQSAPGPESVAIEVQKAIAARRPRARYIRGRTKMRVAVVESLPTVWADTLKRRALGYATDSAS